MHLCRGHSTAPPAPTRRSGTTSWMPTTRLASMPGSTSAASTGRSCPARYATWFLSCQKCSARRCVWEFLNLIPHLGDMTVTVGVPSRADPTSTSFYCFYRRRCGAVRSDGWGAVCDDPSACECHPWSSQVGILPDPCAPVVTRDGRCGRGVLDGGRRRRFQSWW